MGKWNGKRKKINPQKNDVEQSYNNKNFLSFGEILWDIIEGKPYIGGAPFNVAAHLASCGANSCILSCLGKDELGKSAFEKAEQLGVNTSFIQWDENYPTGTVEVFIDEGQPDYTINENVAYDHIEINTALSEINPSYFDCLYFGTLAQRNQVSREAIDWILSHLKFDTVFYDVNLRKGIASKELITKSLAYCNIFKLNQDEISIISNLLFGRSYPVPDFAEKLNEEFNVGVTIVTAAEKGCYIYANRLFSFIPGEKIDLEDAVGAGDAFSAAFLYYYVHQKNPLKAAEIANKLGAFVASSRGAIPAYTPEIKNMLNNLRHQKS